ncbi:MAG: LCP family protein [Bacillota bacterium]
MSDLESTILVRRKRPQPSRPHWGRIAAATILAVALFVGGVMYGAYAFFKGTFQPAPGTEGVVIEPGERINVLFLGVDGGVNGNGPKSDGARADTIVLVSFDTETKEVAALHLPRDTRVQIPGRTGFEKLGHAHAYGGPLLAMETVAQFLGVKVHYYVRVDFAGFIKAVDILGGIELTVEKDLFYEDPLQDLYIDIKAGKQTMDGETALNFVRYRGYPDADIGRIRAQQAFVRAFVNKFYELDILWRIPNLVQSIVPYLNTSMDVSTLLQLAGQALQVKKERIAMEMLPGTPRDMTEGGRVISFWVADPVRTQRVVDLLIRGIDYDANRRTRVEVLSGTTSSEAVELLVAHLNKLGYIVIRTGQADRQTYQTTQLISYTKDDLALRRMTRVVSQVAPKPRLIRRQPPEEYVDFAIIVGADVKQGE